MNTSIQFPLQLNDYLKADFVDLLNSCWGNSECVKVQLSHSIQGWEEQNFFVLKLVNQLHEGTVLRSLKPHPFIIPLVNEYFIQNKNSKFTSALLFPFFERQSIETVISDSRGLRISVVKQIMWQLVYALETIHNCGIIHHDIKPSNILVHDSGNVIIADLGAASVIDQKESTKCYCEQGTPRYQAPEILSKSVSGHDQRCDIWSLGLLMYFLLTGSHWLAGNPSEDLIKIFTFAHEDPIRQDQLKINLLKAGATVLEIELIQNMTRVDANNRITLKGILGSDYFKNFIPTKPFGKTLSKAEFVRKYLTVQVPDTLPSQNIVNADSSRPFFLAESSPYLPIDFDFKTVFGEE